MNIHEHIHHGNSCENIHITKFENSPLSKSIVLEVLKSCESEISEFTCSFRTYFLIYTIVDVCHSKLVTMALCQVKLDFNSTMTGIFTGKILENNSSYFIQFDNNELTGLFLRVWNV